MYICFLEGINTIVKNIGTQAYSILIYVVCVFYVTGTCALEPVQIAFSVNANKKMPVCMVVASDQSGFLERVTPVLIRDLELSGQFAIAKQRDLIVQKRGDITRFADEGYPLVIFIQHDSNTLSWRLYDTTDAEMLAGSKEICTYQDDDYDIYAHQVAQRIWKSLVNQEGIFASCIAFVERDKIAGTISTRSRLCTSDMYGKHKKTWLTSSHVLAAPFWNAMSPSKSLIFSEFTDTNVRLCQISSGLSNMRILMDFDGTAAGGAFVLHDNQWSFVYGHSGALWRYYHDAANKKSVYKRFVCGRATCASPTATDRGTVIYSSAGKLFESDLDGDVIKVVYDKKYAVSPAYCAATGMLVFSARVNTIMQLCTYNYATGEETILTHDACDKTEPCWSPPDGQYVACCVSQGASKRIAIYCLSSGERFFITDDSVYANYPAWR
jgi:hypothetical protein